MRKICFVTTVSLTLRSFVLELAKHMHKTGDFDITFICNPDPIFENSLPEYIHFIPVRMERGISATGFSAVQDLINIFKREKFELVQYSTPNAACYASIAAAVAKVPVRLYCQWGIAYVGFHGLKRWIFKQIEKLVCSLSTWVEPDSFGNLDFSHKEGLYPEEKGSVVLNGSASGVSLDKFDLRKKDEYRTMIRNKYEIPHNAFVFGFVGRINADKGINELFAAMRRVLDIDDGVYLLLIGNSEKSVAVDETLYQWAQDHPHVIFCGFTNNVEQYMAAMDCYVLPSYREGFGSAVIEAEAMGVPVIVTDIPGPTDAMIPNETGLVVPMKDVGGLFEAMLKIKDSGDAYHLFSRRAYDFASNRFEQKMLFDEITKDRHRLLSKIVVH